MRRAHAPLSEDEAAAHAAHARSARTHQSLAWVVLHWHGSSENELHPSVASHAAAAAAPHLSICPAVHAGTSAGSAREGMPQLGGSTAPSELHM